MKKKTLLRERNTKRVRIISNIYNIVHTRTKIKIYLRLSDTICLCIQ